MKRLVAGLVFSAVIPALSQASIINFDFTGGLVVAGSNGDIFLNQGQPVTPIAASLTYDTVTGLGSSGLSITMSDPFLGTPATFHDISMSLQSGTNVIAGQVLVDWGTSLNMPLDIKWDASGLLNAIGLGLQAGDVLSGSTLYHDTNGNGVQDAGEFVADISSATPYSDVLQQDPAYPGPVALQGTAPLAATSSSLGLGVSTPFPGTRGYFDIGSGNSMHVTSVSTVPVPAAIWLFGTGLLGLVGTARRRTR